MQTDYTCGLIDLQTFNSIPNIDSSNNLIHIDSDKVIEIPEGSYEIDDLADFIQNELLKENEDSVFLLTANNSTLKSEILCSYSIDFSRECSIGGLLGFGRVKLNKNVQYTSTFPVNIVKVNTIHVECNIVYGSYLNNKYVHTIHEFSPDVPPGYKIAEVPRNVIYLPVNVRRITSVTLKLVDQDGTLVNFRVDKKPAAYKLSCKNKAYLKSIGLTLKQ